MAKKKDRLNWWREARFGMFIHWGIYAVPAGEWKGKKVDYIGEWIMRREEIPVKEYEKLASKFNPVKFNANQWVKLAKDAGMKYIVITSKHHDGFAMYDSACSDYDIVDATPYKKDPMDALAKACKKYGIKLCFYYSQFQDWHEPNGGMNDWDFDENKKDFQSYVNEKVKPQLRELLSQYGPIGLIWFDTPGAMTRTQSLDLKYYVHLLQPKCLVSGRVGNDVGDYDSMGDNMIPVGKVRGDWETPATLNDTWGFKTHDKNWKSVKTLLYLLVDLAAKGVNYLLNVGPTKEGIIPKPSVDRLREIGQWMKSNGDAIYGTSASPFSNEFDWGRITQKGNTLYLLFYKWPRGIFRLNGIRSKVKSARLLADKRARIRVSQSHDKLNDFHTLELRLPEKKPDKYVSVVELTVVKKVNVDHLPFQQPDGFVTLLAAQSELHTPKKGETMQIGRRGTTENWFTTRNRLSWEMKVNAPGTFKVNLVTTVPNRRAKWFGGHSMRISVGTQTIRKTLSSHEKLNTPRAQYHPETLTNMGTITIRKTGTHQLSLKADKINTRSPYGLMVVEVQLIPVT